jgi:hypothetical protein
MTVSAATRLAPEEIAPDTFVVHAALGEGEAPLVVPMNCMVIRGAEPVAILASHVRLPFRVSFDLSSEGEEAAGEPEEQGGRCHTVAARVV